MSLDSFIDTPTRPPLWGAKFSDDHVYRYQLWRYWDSTKKIVLFVMCNPSIADEIITDPTVERCIKFARMHGFGGMRVCNIFAVIGTDPKVIRETSDPIGPENDLTIMEMNRLSDLTICAWGNH